MRKCTCIGAYEYMYVRNYVECRAPGAAVATAPEPARSLRCDEGFPRSQLLRARASHLTKRPSEKGAEATSCRFANTCHNYTRFLQMYMVAYICIENDWVCVCLATSLHQGFSCNGPEATRCRFAITCHNFTRSLHMYMCVSVCLCIIYMYHSALRGEAIHDVQAAPRALQSNKNRYLQMDGARPMR